MRSHALLFVSIAIMGVVAGCTQSPRHTEIVTTDYPPQYAHGVAPLVGYHSPYPHVIDIPQRNPDPVDYYRNMRPAPPDPFVQAMIMNLMRSRGGGGSATGGQVQQPQRYSHQYSQER